MSEHPFNCPSCKQTYPIFKYSIGMSDILELRCSNCATSLHIDLYDPIMLDLYKKYGQYTGGFFENLYNSLKPCRCGGQYLAAAAYRCQKCNIAVSLDEIKKQIGYKGNGTPGIAMANIINSSDTKDNIWKNPEDIKPIKRWWKFWQKT